MERSEAKRNEVNFLLGLPAEMKLKIVSYLNKPTQVVLSRTCRDLRGILSGQATRRVVRELCRHKRLALLALVERDDLLFEQHRCGKFVNFTKFLGDVIDFSSSCI